jgi:UDP-N-acetylglucosamine--N-acetylmuramyl-(pentapeptide) pyrophosphoryl-undecaprenol N-acetylglucosamine transferase
MSKCALIMAGGTGGHIFPGLALAEALRGKGWRVHWLGGRGAPGRPSMESRLVPARGFAFEAIDFSGVRGKAFTTLLWLPPRLLRAFWQSLQLLRRVKPDVLVGLGGYIAFPASMMSVVVGKPLVLHEQNAVAGTVNRLLAGIADRVFTAFPDVLRKGRCVGNPLRDVFLVQATPQERFRGRSGALELLVLGGSLGAQALNQAVPQALALIDAPQRPRVSHQCGAGHQPETAGLYRAAGVLAEVVDFIDDTAGAFAQADLVLCRAGASTVTELAAVGAAALFVPLPSAVDDHQSANARYLADAGAAWLLPQSELTPQRLAHLLRGMDRAELLQRANAARALARTGATESIVAACEELTGREERA